jgi:hypothetical protein
MLAVHKRDGARQYADGEIWVISIAGERVRDEASDYHVEQTALALCLYWNDRTKTHHQF